MLRLYVDGDDDNRCLLVMMTAMLMVMLTGDVDGTCMYPSTELVSDVDADVDVDGDVE